MFSLEGLGFIQWANSENWSRVSVNSSELWRSPVLDPWRIPSWLLYHSERASISVRLWLRPIYMLLSDCRRNIRLKLGCQAGWELWFSRLLLGFFSLKWRACGLVLGAEKNLHLSVCSLLNHRWSSIHCLTMALIVRGSWCGGRVSGVQAAAGRSESFRCDKYRRNKTVVLPPSVILFLLPVKTLCVLKLKHTSTASLSPTLCLNNSPRRLPFRSLAVVHRKESPSSGRFSTPSRRPW